MLDIFKKKMPKTNKQNLKHFKHFFKSSLIYKPSNKTKSNVKGKKKTTESNNVSKQLKESKKQPRNLQAIAAMIHYIYNKSLLLFGMLIGYRFRLNK